MFNRRDVMKGLLASSVIPPFIRGLSAKHVVVVGAGIVGASIAYHLSLMGAKVTVIDKEGPASHASRGTFAWINASYAKQPQHYHAFSQKSVALWHQLSDALNIPVRWEGSLEWFDSRERMAKLAHQIEEQATWGEKSRMISAAELARIVPSIDPLSAESVAFAANDGAVDPVLATNIFLKAAKARGATIKYPCELQGVDERADGGLKLDANTGMIEADHLVLATGAADMARKITGYKIPQRSTPGIILVTKPMPQMVGPIVAAPGVHLHQRLDGRFVIGEQDGAPDNAAHKMRLEGRPNAFPAREFADLHATRMIAAAARYIPALEKAEAEHVYIGWRPLPIDGHPVLGPVPGVSNVHLAVMHSGVTLAPIAGQLIAKEIMGEAPVAELDSYRPDRNFETINRY
jgi:glycine/D-amino acid oxidase-like deaminating enzyme